MHSIILNTTTKEIFRKKWNSFKAGPDIDNGYLTNSTFKGVYVNGDLCGGYIINTNLNCSRYLKHVPDSIQKDQMLKLLNNDFCEVTCIWMDRTVIKKIYSRIYFYYIVIKDMYNAKKNYIVGGTTILKVKRIQTIVFDKPLWEGHSVGTGAYRYLYYVERNKLFRKFIFGIFLYPIILFTSRFVKIKHT